MITARAKAMGLPAARAVHFANRLKNEDDFPGLILFSCALEALQQFSPLQTLKILFRHFMDQVATTVFVPG
jgi:hypothetical protein